MLVGREGCEGTACMRAGGACVPTGAGRRGDAAGGRERGAGETRAGAGWRGGRDGSGAPGRHGSGCQPSAAAGQV